MSFNNILKNWLFDKNGVFKAKILKNPLFISVLLIKVILAMLFASPIFTGFFIKFINYYVGYGFQDPYNFFYINNSPESFPYPSLMLYILSFPRIIFNYFLPFDYNTITNFHIFIFRMPLLVADIVNFIILIRWLKTKQKEVLIYYWCSPILIYISYIHGQLDVIPIMFLLWSLYYLFKEKYLISCFLLGLGISCKTNILIVIPFYIVYLISKKIGFIKLTRNLMVLIATFLILNLPYIFTEAFIKMVFANREQPKLFDLMHSMNNNLVFYVIPGSYLILFIKSLSYKTYNKDIFLMYIGFSFTILTAFIPPMQGWYYWVIPFMSYFYIKHENASKFSFILLNALYIIYFALIKNSDYFEVFQFISKNIVDKENIYNFLIKSGLNADRLLNIVFTLLQTTLLINGLWIYKIGVGSNLQYKIKYHPYMVGIAGDSGAGKSTVSELIVKLFGKKNSLIVRGDDMHKWERGNENWHTYTHLNPNANRLHTDMEQTMNLKKGINIKRSSYDHSNGKFTLPNEIEPNKLTIIEGLHSFYINKMRELFDIKIFVKPEEQLRLHWKVIRDTSKRSYSKDEVIKNLEKREADSQKYIQSQEKFADIIISINNKGQINNIGSENEKTDLYLKFEFDNNLNIEQFINEINKIDTLEIIHYFDENFQNLELYGTVSKEKLSKLGYNLIPELEDVSVTDPEWVENYNGLIQLFLGFYIFKKMKLAV